MVHFNYVKIAFSDRPYCAEDVLARLINKR